MDQPGIVSNLKPKGKPKIVSNLKLAQEPATTGRDPVGELDGGACGGLSRSVLRNLKRKRQRQEQKQPKKNTAADEMGQYMEQSLEAAVEGGRIFAQNTENSREQRRVLGTAILGSDGGQGRAIPVNPIGAVKKKRRKEAKLEKRKEGFAKLLDLEAKIPKKEVFDGEKCSSVAQFYMGSRLHIPPLPEVDGKVRDPTKRRSVVSDFVEESLEVIDSTEGIESRYFTLIRTTKAGSEGNASGNGTNDRRSKDPDNGRELYLAFKAMEGKKRGSDSRSNQSGKRIAAMDGDGSCYINFGTNGNIFGGGVKTDIKRLEGKDHAFGVFSRWVRSTENAALQYLSPYARKIFEALKNECEHPNMPLAKGREGNTWPALAAGRNVFLNVHIDEDYTWSLTSVIPEDDGGAEDERIICYFCFPTLKIAVPLRKWDILLFNARVPHCVSSRCDGTKDAFCVSMYTSAAIPGGNKNPPHNNAAGEGSTRGDRNAVEAIVKEKVMQHKKSLK